MQAVIAAARDCDLPAILELLDRTRLPRAGIEQHMGTAVVARGGDRVVGCAALEVHGTAGLLRSVAVESEWRGKGLGQELSRAVLDLARARRLETVYLLTETAAEFFPRLGFRRVERDAVDPAVKASVEFTTACPASAVVMALRLKR